MCNKVCFVAQVAMCLLSAMPSLACNIEVTFSGATEFLKHRQWEQAYTALALLRSCNNLTPIERFQLGWLLGRARHFEEALDEFEAVPSDVPDLPTHQYAAALSNFELGRYSQAARILSVLKSKTALDEKSANLLGVSLSKLGQYQEAFSIFDDVVKRYPSDPTAYFNRVTACVDGGSLEKAAELAGELTSTFPADYQSFVAFGAAETLLGHLDSAHGAFTKAIALAPGQPDPRFFQSLVSYKQDKFDAALKELDTASSAGIRDSDLHYLKAECLVRLDPSKLSGIFAELDEAIRLNPASVSALALRGKLELAAQQKDKALRDLERAHALDPKSRSAAYNLARIYQSMGHTAEAKTLFAQVAEQASDPLRELTDRRINQALRGGAQ